MFEKKYNDAETFEECKKKCNEFFNIIIQINNKSFDDVQNSQIYYYHDWKLFTKKKSGECECKLNFK